MDDGAVFDRDLLAEDHIRLDHNVAAEFGVGGEEHRLRRNQRNPSVQRGLTQALLRYSFRFGELALGVDTAHVVLLDFDRDCAQLHAARDLDRIGQIKFVFAIVVADPVQDGKRTVAGERHQPAIAQGDGAFGRAGVGLLADGEELIALNNETAIARWIGGAKAQNRQCGACGKRRT